MTAVGARLSAGLLSDKPHEHQSLFVEKTTMPVSASTKTGQRKLHRSKEKLEDMPLQKVMNEAKRKKGKEFYLDSIWGKE